MVGSESKIPVSMVVTLGQQHQSCTAVNTIGVGTDVVLKEPFR